MGTKYCKLNWDEDKQAWRCEACGSVYHLPKTQESIFAECRAASLPKKVANYTKAIITHLATGMENRTDEEVIQRLVICKQCDHFDIPGSFCKLCGCHCNMNKSAFTNKIRMKSQACPMHKWD